MLAGLVDVLFGANLGGLWLLLAGWFLMTAASVEWQRTRLAVAMQGVMVRDVMGPPPAVGPGRLTVEEFLTDVVLPSGKRVFAILTFDRHLDGIVTLPMLQLMPAAQRAERRMSQVRIPIAQVPVVAPDEPGIRPARAGRRPAHRRGRPGGRPRAAGRRWSGWTTIRPRSGWSVSSRRTSWRTRWRLRRCVGRPTRPPAGPPVPRQAGTPPEGRT